MNIDKLLPDYEGQSKAQLEHYFTCFASQFGKKMLRQLPKVVIPTSGEEQQEAISSQKQHLMLAYEQMKGIVRHDVKKREELLLIESAKCINSTQMKLKHIQNEKMNQMLIPNLTLTVRLKCASVAHELNAREAVPGLEES